MRKQVVIALAFLTFTCLGLRTASAQFGGVKIPKVSKPKPTPTPVAASSPQPDANRTEAPSAPAVPSVPPGLMAVNLNSLLVNVRTANASPKNNKVWNWVPYVRFNITQNLADGDRLYFEAAPPGGPAMKAVCEWDDGRGAAFECGKAFPEEQGSTYTGPLNFAIKLRNALEGTDVTLFTGVVKVAQGCAYDAPCKTSGKWAYYVSYDWALPIGGLFYDTSDSREIPSFGVRFWVRGEPGKLEPHLYYQGKKIQQPGRPYCSTEDELTLTQVPQGVERVGWKRIKCFIPGVIRWDKNPPHLQTTQESFHMAKNPGDYEFRLLRGEQGELARSIKFRVGPDGSLDDSITKSNNLNSGSAIVPVMVIGDQDGPWDRTAWKTDAYFGHPLKGFTWPPQ